MLFGNKQSQLITAVSHLPDAILLVLGFTGETAVSFARTYQTGITGLLIGVGVSKKGNGRCFSVADPGGFVFARQRGLQYRRRC